MAGRRRPTRGSPGQHFLRSKQLAGDIVAEADLERGDLVLEIGGGTGVLTQALAQAGARVLVLERDPALAARLRERFGHRAAVSVVETDAVDYVWPGEPFAVVANLPFARSGAILTRLLRDPAIPLRRADVIVQWEFAAKHTAVCPATLRTTYWRAWFDVSIARRLDRSAFAPPPSVDAAVVRLERRVTPRIPLRSRGPTGASCKPPSEHKSRSAAASGTRSLRLRSSVWRRRSALPGRLAPGSSMPSSGRGSSPSLVDSR